MSRPSTMLFVPCYNERGRIGPLLQSLRSAAAEVDEIVVVDDGSTDGSLQRILDADADCTVFRHRRRLGLGHAFRTAFGHVLRSEYAIFAVMAGNGKDHPGDLPRVIGPVQSGTADFVQGSRFHPDGGVSRDLPSHRDLAIRLFTRALGWRCALPLTDASNGFRAYTTRLLRDPAIDWCAPWLGAGYQVEIHLLIAAARLGYRVTEVPVQKSYPRDGEAYSKASLVDWWRMVKPWVWSLGGLDRVASVRRAPDHPAADQVECVRSATAQRGRRR